MELVELRAPTLRAVLEVDEEEVVDNNHDSMSTSLVTVGRPLNGQSALLNDSSDSFLALS